MTLRFTKISAAAALVAAAVSGVGDFSRLSGGGLRLAAAPAVGPAVSQAPVQFELRDTLFQRLFQVLIPVIDGLVPTVTVPEINVDGIRIWPFRFQSFNVGNIAVAFAAPATAKAAIDGLTVHADGIKMHIKKKISIISIDCNATASFNVTDFSMGVALGLGRNATDGGLDVASAAGTSAFPKPLGIQLKLSGGLMCDIANPVVRGLIPKIEALIKGHLASAVASLAKTELDKLLAAAPLPLATPPVATAHSLTMAVDFLRVVDRLAIRPAPARPTARPLRRVRGAPVPAPRDVAALLPSASLNAIMRELAKRGLLDHSIVLPGTVNTSVLRPYFPKAYAVCPGCPLVVGAKATPATAPVFSFEGGAMSVLLRGLELDIGARNASGGVLPLWDLAATTGVALQDVAVGGVDQSTVTFTLAIPSFKARTIVSHIGPVNDATLSELITTVLHDVLVPAVNKIFAKGVSLSFAGVGLINLILRDSQGWSVMEADLSLIPH